MLYGNLISIIYCRLYRLQIKKKEQQTNEIKEQRKELSNIENHLNEKKEKLKLQVSYLTTK